MSGNAKNGARSETKMTAICKSGAIKKVKEVFEQPKHKEIYVQNMIFFF